MMKAWTGPRAALHAPPRPPVEYAKLECTEVAGKAAAAA